MSDPPWENLKEIFHAALALTDNERASYLTRVCDGNNPLRQAVEKLINDHEKTSNFLDAPAYQIAAEMLVEGQEFKRGQVVAHYKVLSTLGEGGMGKVYLAQDTKLDRKVGLKFLPAELATNPNHMRRFTQEAKSAAALNHPNIAQIFEIGEHNRANYIAMEYVEGETLRQLLVRRKLDIKQAVELAAQVASGLSAAHKEGVIHRDIKPENLIVTASGRIKILDFGLAKIVEKQRGAGVSELSTAYLHHGDRADTVAGAIMGTVSYMSPEQARAEKLDQRTDIFSLGVVLYEMITGDRPFTGKSAIDTLHAIINHEPPPVSQLNSQTPPELADILAKALAKDPSERYQHAGDFELDLRRFKRALESNTLISGLRFVTPESTRRRSVSMPVLIAGSAIVLGIAAVAWMLGSSTAATKRAVALEGVTLTPLTRDPGYEGEPTFSIDGQTIAYVSDRTGDFEIFLKQVSGGPDINITNNKADEVQPAFSPDGKQIAFVSTRASSSNLLYPGVDFSLLGGDIWVMPALGGSPRRIAESGNFPSWSPDGTTILYAKGTAWFKPKMLRVAAQGGEPQEIPITFKAGEPPQPFWLYPSYSSGMRWIAFEAGGNIFVVSAEGGEARRIVKGRRPVWGTNSQVLIYSNTEPGKNFSLWQVPFSSTEGATSGTPEPLTVGRGRDTQAAVSNDGKLIAFSAQDLSFNVETMPFDAEAGRQTSEPQSATFGSNTIYFLSFSPDGRSIVFQSNQGASSNIWRVDRGSDPVQLTADPNFNDSAPRWSPDGQTIAFIRRPNNDTQQMVMQGKGASLWLMSADGGNPRLLIENAGNPTWMPSGLALAYGSVVDGRQSQQIYIFDLATKVGRQLTNEPGVVPISTFSPDGKWLIYQSNPSGHIDLRAIPVEGGESRIAVATPHQDYHPFVSPSGKWLYFQLDHKNIYRVPGPAQDWHKAEPEKVTNFPESGLFLEDPQISRDGRLLLYSHGRITGDIWIINLGR